MHRVRVSVFVLALAGWAAAPAAPPAFAGASAWLPAPSSGNVSVSYTFQTADEYYRKIGPADRRGPSSKRKLPEDLIQHTVWLDASYGLLDEVALDVRLGLADSDFWRKHGASGGKNGYTGLADTSLGVTYRLLDETISESALTPSLALRAGGIIAGDYETGYVNALGDGGNGFELSMLAGKFLADRFAVSGEFGYRNRDNDIPDDLFLRLSGGVLLWNRVGLSVNYERIDTPWTDFDIADPGFTPDRFPEVAEEVQVIGAGVNVTVLDRVNLGFAYATVVDGRNTADSDVFSVSLGYAFDTF